MKLQILLNTEIPSFTAIQRDLFKELESTGWLVNTERRPPPDGTMSVEEVVKFFIQVSADKIEPILLHLALLEIIKNVFMRHDVQTAKKGENPAALLLSDGEAGALPLPATASAEKRHLAHFKQPRKLSAESKPRARPQKSKSNAKAASTAKRAPKKRQHARPMAGRRRTRK